MTDAPKTAHERLDGVVIGVLMGFAEDGAPLVVFPGNRSSEAIAARTTAALHPDDIGSDVALMFEAGDASRPIILGRLLHAPTRPPRVEIARDQERLELTADREIVLRCGKATITLTRAGKVLIRGAYVLSRSTGVNKIKGGSVQLN